MFKRKLFKRALPVILSVAMIFQSMPATALAAENETTEVVETTVEDSGSESDAGDEANEPANEEPEAPAAEQPEASAPAQESKQEEVSVSTEEAKQEETSTPAESTTQEETSAPVETAAPETTGVEEEATDEDLQQAEADEVAAAKIIVDEEQLKSNLTYGFKYEDGVVSGSYNPDTKIFDSFVNKTLKNVSGTVISIRVGDKADDTLSANLKEKLSFQWNKVEKQEGAEDKLTPLSAGETPKDAGIYRLVLSLEAVDGLCGKAEDVGIDFEIKQAELTIDDVDVDDPEVGTKISDFVNSFKEDYILKSNDTEINKDTYVKDVKVTVKDSITGNEITDAEAVFENDKNYSYTVAIELSDPNYIVKDFGVRDIQFAAVIKTSMVVTLPKNIEYIYGDEIKLPVAGTDYTVKVLYTDRETGTETELQVPADGITAQWLDADGNVLVDADGKEIVPVDAGTYYVLLTYKDAAGRYKECTNRIPTHDEYGNKIDDDRITNIVVKVNPVSIYIKPSLAKTEYTDGKTAADILQDVTYELFKTAGDTQLTSSEFDKKTGWGVSYNNDEKTQYYEPVFELQAAKVKRDEEGNPKKDKDGNLEYEEYVAVEEDDKLVGGGELAKYRIVFSGNKAVYSGFGWADTATDINDGANSAVPNYKVDTTPETIEKNVVELTITKSTTVIDVSKYTECTDGKYIKVFDYAPVYEKREDYKKAAVDNSGDGLKYQWYTAVVNKIEEKDESGNVVKTEYEYEKDRQMFNFNYTDKDGEHMCISPAIAGAYILSISYDDPKHEKAADDVELVYIIEPQKVAAEVTTGTEGNKVTAYSDTTIREFLDKNLETMTTVIKKAEGNDLSKLVDDEILNLWEYGFEYGLTPIVERQDNLDPEKWWEVALTDSEGSDTEFIEGSHYRISFGVDIYYVNLPINDPLGDFFQVNYQGYDKEAEKYYPSNYIDITVEKMGTTELELKIDESQIVTTTKVYDGTPFEIPAGAVTVYNKNTGEQVTDVTLEYEWLDSTKGDYVNSDEAVNGGKYTLYAYFDGNSNYAPFGYTQIGVKDAFEITKREISVAPILISDEVEAGLSSSSLSEIVMNATDYEGDVLYYGLLFGGDILNTETISDMAAFMPGKWYDEYYNICSGYKAVARDGLNVTGTDGSKVSDSVLKSENTYYVVPNVTLRAPYNRNYNVTNVKAELTAVRGSASVSKTSNGIVPETSLKDFKGNSTEDPKVITHKIVPREGIPYILANERNTLKDEDGKVISGNLFVFQIRAPKEFYYAGNEWSSLTNSFNPIYENEIAREIKKYGGYLFTKESDTKNNRGIITVAFKTEGKDEQPTFKVRWSDGYLEEFTVDFTDAVLEADLTKAVAPKSLAFNAPAKKMVIGEKQQLDVKVTKKKLDDVICLRYESDNTNVLSVSETGAVVALATGSATVKAIPCYEDETGVKKDIEGAKAATVKISVVDVTAPKIKTVTALDVSAKVSYPKLSDGYRREIYVLESPNAKEGDFTAAIDKLKNGDWKNAGFATAPKYGSYYEKYDDKTKLSTVNISGLKANTQYTVYVRNVSGVRKLADGTSVVASAKGAVKTFKTTASQVQDLKVVFDDKYWAEEPVKYVDGGYLVNVYVADISEKKVPSITVGTFLENAKNTNANTGDEIDYVLPFAKRAEELTYYAQPKLSYIVSSSAGVNEEGDSYGYRLEAGGSYTVKIGNRFYTPSNVAKIDKKGNITLTGKGKVDVVVYDAITNQYGYGHLYITAEATKMTIAKSAKVRVGEALHLEDYVTYYAGKQKLTNYMPNLRVKVSTNSDIDAFDLGSAPNDPVDYIRYFVAKEPKKTLTLEVTDISMESTDNKGIIKITSTDIAAVKNLKVSEVVDKYATVSFTYPDTNGATYEYDDDSETDETINQLYFRIQVLDAAKNIVSDNYYNYWDFDDTSYDAKKKTDTFTKYIGFDKPLNRKSSYTVSVTATYLKNEAVSKPATKGFKTTDIPAARQAEYDGCFYRYDTKPNSQYLKDDGGIGISVNNNVDLSEYRALTSNNTYTLVAYPQNDEAKNRLSDTLTWKSTDTKVATVKANAGSYTATLKTLKKGTTKIELVSKITKKIIARWTVFVNATGEASYYFGEWEPDQDKTDDVVGSEEFGDMEILTMDNPVRATLAVGEGKIAKFVAPEYGRYNFDNFTSVDETLDMRVYRLDNNGKPEYLTDIRHTSYSEQLQKGEVRYIQVVNALQSTQSVTIEAYGEIYKTWTGVGEYTIEEYSSIAFTAPEDNYYTFTNKKTGKSVEEFGLEAGKTKVIYLNKGTYTVTKREPVVIDDKGLTDQNITDKATNWYVFTAPSDMSYTFGLSNDSKALSLQVYKKITQSPNEAINGNKVELQKDDKIYISVENKSLDAVKTNITVKADAVVGTAIDVTKETSTTVMLEKANEGQFVQYTIPEDGFYRFKVSGIKEKTEAKETEAAAVSAYLTYNIQDPYGTPLGSSYETPTKLNKGDVKYVYVLSEEDNVTAEIKIAKINVKDIKAGDTSDTLSRDYSYYKFTAESDGEYAFRVKVTERTGDDKDTTPTANVTCVKGKEFGINIFYYDYGSDLSLKKGDIVYIRVNTTDTQGKSDNATIVVSKLEAEEFTSTWTGKIAEGETKWLQFKASKDTLYSFTSEDKRTDDGKGIVTVGTSNTVGSAYTNPLYVANRLYKVGQTVYLKLTAENGEAECTITAMPVVPEKVTGAAFTVEKNSDKWFEYTAPATARYSAKLTGNGAESCAISRGTSLTSMASVGIVSDFNMDAGQTVYFKISNPTDAAKTVTLDVSMISPVVLNLTDKTSDTASMTDEDAVWYSFKADKAGRYSFKSTAQTAEGKIAKVSMNYYADAAGKKPIQGVYNPESAVLVKANETIYIRVKLTGDDASVTTTVKAITPADITAKVGAPVEKTEADVAAGNYNWYEIKGEGTYTISASDVSENGVYSVQYVYNNGSFVGGSLPMDVSLGKGDVVTVAIRSNTDKLGYKLTSTMREVKELTLTAPVTGSLKTGEDLYVSFKAPEGGRYAVYLEGVKEGVTSRLNMMMSDADDYYGELTNDNYYSVCTAINGKFTFRINVTSEESVDFTVKAEKVSATDITASGSATIEVARTPIGYTNWYSYTPAESGKYIIKASDAKTVVFYGDFEEIPSLGNDFIECAQMPYEELLRKDTTYYYAVNYTEKPESDVTFSITKAVANELETEYTVDVSKLLPNERIYLLFTAPADGRYVFNSSDATVSAECYSKVDSEESSSFSFNTEKPMKAGQELVLAVYAKAVPKENFKISVSSITLKVLEVSTEDESKEVSADLSADEVLWVSFTSGETAQYRFTLTNVYSAYMYKKLSDESGVWVSDYTSYPIDKGQTVYLKLTPNTYNIDAETGKIKVGIKATVDSQMVKLSVQANEVTDIEAKSSKWAYFTADTAGFYKFTVSGKNRVSVRNSNSYLREIGVDGFRYGLAEGDSLYFEIQNETDDVVSDTITVIKDTEIKELAVGTPSNVVPDNNNVAWYVIKAAEKGVYNITISNDNNQAANGYIYNSPEGGSIQSFWKSDILQLEKGDVKYLRINTSLQDCVVTCTKVSEQVLTDAAPLKLTLQKGESVLVKWSVEGSEWSRIKFTADKSVDYKYYGNGADSGYTTNSTGTKGTWPAYNGDEKQLILEAQEDDTEIVVFAEEVKESYFYGDSVLSLNSLSKGDAILVNWYCNNSGTYRFNVSGNVECVHYMNGVNNYPDYGTSWEWSEASSNYKYILVEALADNTDAIVSATKVIRNLQAGSSVSSNIAYYDTETFTFTAPEKGQYIFSTSGTSSVEGWLTYEGAEEGRSVSAYNYGMTDNNVFIICDLEDAQKVSFTIRKISNDSNPVNVGIYSHGEIFTGTIDRAEFYTSPKVSTTWGQEAWFMFDVSESGMYEFTSDSYTCMKLYDNDTKELLGTFESPWLYPKRIKVWLDADTKVLLRTWYDTNHGSATYQISVAPVEADSYTTKQYLYYNNDNQSTYIGMGNTDGQQAEILYSYSASADETGVKLRFYINDDSAYHMALYVGDNEDPVKVSDVNELSYAVASEYFDSIRLVVWKDGYRAFNSYVYCTIEGHDYTGSHNSSVNVYIPEDGSSTVTYNEIEQDGKYVFYSQSSAVMAAVVNRNGVEEALTLENETVSDTGFQYTLALEKGDVVTFTLSGAESMFLSLYEYKITESTELGTDLSGTANNVSVSVSTRTIKTTEYTVKQAGKYVFTPSTSYNNGKFELIVGNKTYTEWNTSTESIELAENDRVTFKVWNADKYGFISASLNISYEASETEPETPSTEESSDDSSTSTEESTEDGSTSTEESPEGSSTSTEESSDESSTSTEESPEGSSTSTEESSDESSTSTEGDPEDSSTSTEGSGESISVEKEEISEEEETI
ncbi:MAG: Ig-like domain-containing protein [Lachnospiraceae bacterium]|nr:Ig-like domain-containing protein [Lachnospiraceae bacterium]